MYNILLIVQILVALGIISLVLVQHGKGADAGAAFGGGGAAGGGASGSVFGSRGAGNFLSRTTAILAVVFFLNSMGLAWLVSHRDGGGSSSLVDSATPVEQTVPAVSSDVPEVPGTAVPEAKAENGVPAVEATAPAASTESAPAPAVTKESVPEAGASTAAPAANSVPEATAPVVAPVADSIPAAPAASVPEVPAK